MLRGFMTLLLAAFTLSGCGDHIKDANVNLHTNGKGQLSRVVIVRSSGNPDGDDALIRRARQNFSRVVPNPRKNTVYHQPAKVILAPEPLFK